MLPLARRTQRERGDAEGRPRRKRLSAQRIVAIDPGDHAEAQSGSSLDRHVTCFGISRGISVAIAAERHFVRHQAFSALIIGSALGNSQAFASSVRRISYSRPKARAGLAFDMRSISAWENPFLSSASKNIAIPSGCKGFPTWPRSLERMQELTPTSRIALA